MDLNLLLPSEEERPLEKLVSDGGYCGIFRTVACVGDSLSSGEFEATNGEGKTTYHDFFDYSWGQFLGRMCQSKVFNFSKGGMTAERYCESYANLKGFWDPEKACQAYIIALGVNDLWNNGGEVGSVEDICLDDWKRNRKSYAGYFGQIVQRYREIQPRAKFFFVTLPRQHMQNAERTRIGDAQAKLMYDMAALFPNSYVIDLRAYGADYDDPAVKKAFFMGGHMNTVGYAMTARLIASYIDYIIRHNFADFAQVGFIGTPYQKKLSGGAI